jgi:hypothetical protein
MIWLYNLSILSVPEEVCSRNAPCALNWISTFIEKGRTTQWPEEKGQKNKQRSTKHYTEN